MRMPTQLRVGPYTYTVATDTAELDRRSRESRRDLLGECCTTTQSIAVRTEDVSPGAVIDTLLHEALHAVIGVHAVDAGDYDEEEKLVRQLTPGLVALLRDNPELVAAITQDLP